MSQSLVISPNLEALLEYDERTRQRTGSQTWASAPASALGSPIIMSLPAPPRSRGGRKKVPISPSGRSESPATSPTSPNPFVNPSPSFPSRESLLRSARARSSSLPAGAVDKLEIENDATTLAEEKVDPAETTGSNSSIPSSPAPTTPTSQKRRKLVKRTVKSAPTGTIMGHHPYSSEAETNRLSRTGSYEPPDRRSSLSSPSLNPARTSFIDLMSPSESDKPPIPSSPKPNFSYRQKSSRSSPNQRDEFNLLNSNERAGLVRKSKKLAQVFGQTPEARVLSDSVRTSFLDIPKTRHTKGSLSVNSRQNLHPLWPPSEETQYFTVNGRRHSSPLTPDDFSFLSQMSGGDPRDSTNGAESPTSFIDLSDEEADALSAITPVQQHRRPSSPSNRSLFENMTPAEQAEEERKRKREKLAKLHRFLGSRVPTELVFDGLDNLDMSAADETTNKAWLRRRRSSSAAAFPSHWSDDLDRLREELNDEEKALNVRRAVKMEKVFGIAPPQTLYHTRPTAISPSSTSETTRSSRTVKPISPEVYSPSSPSRNVNQSSYKGKKNERPSSSESSRQLLPKGRTSEDQFSDRSAQAQRTSLVYSHYQHSLNSLDDILDRDDKESLAELHQFITDIPPSPGFKDFARKERPLSISSSIKSERRRSLPARTSMLSLVSEYSVSTPRPEVTDFQLRRKKAAKLTNFFGVDYRSIIRDVLDSIEHGLDHECQRGTINPDEAEELLRKLRSIKTKRDGIF